jgi:hypothetical protein
MQMSDSNDVILMPFDHHVFIVPCRCSYRWMDNRRCTMQVRYHATLSSSRTLITVAIGVLAFAVASMSAEALVDPRQQDRPLTRYEIEFLESNWNLATGQMVKVASDSGNPAEVNQQADYLDKRGVSEQYSRLVAQTNALAADSDEGSNDHLCVSENTVAVTSGPGAGLSDYWCVEVGSTSPASTSCGSAAENEQFPAHRARTR